MRVGEQGREPIHWGKKDGVGGHSLGRLLAWGGQSSPLKRRGWVLEWPLG